MALEDLQVGKNLTAGRFWALVVVSGGKTELSMDFPTLGDGSHVEFLSWILTENK
jgi:hypothetical protein